MKIIRNLQGIIALLILLGSGSASKAQSYVSPFEISLTNAIVNWTTDFASRSAEITNYSQPSPSAWYTDPLGSYGPTLPQLYSSSSVQDPSALSYDRGAPVYNSLLNSNAPSGVDQITYDQQRLLYAAQLLIGTSYQHVHLPQFDGALASNNYSWLPVTTNTYLQTSQELLTNHTMNSGISNPYVANYGKATNGIDCTDFAAFIYNEALGIQMHSGTDNQIIVTNGAPTADVYSSTGDKLTPTFFTNSNYGTSQLNTNNAAEMSSIEAQLRPGDLLYMKGDSNTILHVVVWLGIYGTDTNGNSTGVPLVISSHDNTPAIFNTTNLDSNGLPVGLITNNGTNNITDFLPPPGVEILPFTSNTWFYQNFDVAMQVLPTAVPEPSAYVLFGLGSLVLLVAYQRRA